MPPRHCVFIGDLAEMEKSFSEPVSVYASEFVQNRPVGDKIREYAELAFANENQIQQLRKGDRETMVMARRMRSSGQDSLTELPAHLNDLTGDYVRTRTVSQFKWLLHTFAASGRAWIQELVCGSGREWVEETLNLLFVQRGFASSPEDAEEYRLAREIFLKLVGPFGVSESGRVVEDPHPVTEEAFRWLPREDGVVHFRLAPAFALPTLGRVLTELELSPEAFQEAGRATDPRLQGLARETCARLRAFVQLPFQKPALLAFIGT